MTMKDFKIVFTGTPGAGKTTAIAALSDTPPVSTEVQNTDVRLHKARTTVGLDFGQVDLGDGQCVRLFGTPGQVRFEFMWRIVATDAPSSKFLPPMPPHRHCARCRPSWSTWTAPAPSWSPAPTASSSRTAAAWPWRRPAWRHWSERLVNDA